MSSIFAISMVKNEADVIESFIRYHLNIFDGIVILDNGSTDNTLYILESLMAEGLPVYLQYDTSLEYFQDEKTTELMYHAFEQYEPDIIFPLDADEFIISADPSIHPRDVLDQLEFNKIYYTKTKQYVPTKLDKTKELFIPKRILHSYGDVELYKVVVTKEIAYEYWPTLSMGNHDLIFDTSVDSSIDRITIKKLKLSHFSFRSVEQAKSKIIVGWLNNLSRHTRKKDDCFHWEYWFNLFKQKETLDYEWIDELTSDLYGDKKSTLQPMFLSFCKGLELKYTNDNEVNALKNLLEFCERLAEEYAELKRIEQA